MFQNVEKVLLHVEYKIVGVDVVSGYVRTFETTADNEHDITVTSKLIRAENAVKYALF